MQVLERKEIGHGKGPDLPEFPDDGVKALLQGYTGRLRPPPGKLNTQGIDKNGVDLEAVDD